MWWSAQWSIQWTNEICVCYSHYCGVIMGATASQITSLTIVYSTVYSDADQRKHQGSASLAFVRGIHRGPVQFPAQMASNAENVYIWWRHHECYKISASVWVRWSRWQFIKTYLYKQCILLFHNLALMDFISIFFVNSPYCRIYPSINWVSIGSDNGLSPIRRQAII